MVVALPPNFSCYTHFLTNSFKLIIQNYLHIPSLPYYTLPFHFFVIPLLILCSNSVLFTPLFPSCCIFYCLHTIAFCLLPSFVLIFFLWLPYFYNTFMAPVLFHLSIHTKRSLGSFDAVCSPHSAWLLLHSWGGLEVPHYPSLPTAHYRLFPGPTEPTEWLYRRLLWLATRGWSGQVRRRNRKVF